MNTAAVFGKVVNQRPNISKSYIEHIKSCGIETHIVYNQNPNQIAKEHDYLIVCGGGDIDPHLYGQHPIENLKYDREFDIIEKNLISAFIFQNKSILGICRGMQSINVTLGGTLIQDIPSVLGYYHSNCGGRVCHHEIKISKTSKLYKAMGLRAIVNSYHHQCIDKIGKNLNIVSTAHDGIIEAIESDKYKILGVQWHPERMNGNAVFEHFFSNY